MTQPATNFTPRMLVRSVPFSTPAAGITTPLGAGLGISVPFDVALAISDRNRIGYSTPQAGFGIGTGFFLDASMFMNQASTIDVLVTATLGGTPLSVMAGGVPLAVAASTLTLVAGLRVIGSFVTVAFVNTSGVNATLEYFVAIRSE
jgi:hypothetical protein